MRKYSFLSTLLTALAVLLSDIMCAVVAYNYCSLEWGGKYSGFSAPPDVAFFLAIPFLAGILVCLGLAWSFRRKAKKARRDADAQQTDSNSSKK